MGAIGVTRTFSYGGRMGIPMYSRVKDTDSTINHFYEKLLKLKDSLNTETARRITEERHAFMEAFLLRFLKEAEGKHRSTACFKNFWFLRVDLDAGGFHRSSRIR